MDNKKTKEIMDAQTTEILEKYKKTLDLLDAYDHKTLMCPKGTYYDGYESAEEVAAELLYLLVKDCTEDGYNKRDAAIGFLSFLELNNALFVKGKKVISDALLIALILMIDKSREEEKEMIIRLVINCML